MIIYYLRIKERNLYGKGYISQRYRDDIFFTIKKINNQT
jgi:hypothetical protein